MTTNRDKINAMTNEKLASLLTSDCTCHCTFKGWDWDCGDEDNCIANIVKWLESEVEG